MLAALAPRCVPLPAWFREAPAATVVTLFDRAGGTLARLQEPASPRVEPVRLPDLDPSLVTATLAAEDQRFFHHPGVDPIALARASWRSLTRGVPLSGASTLTMQVVRLARGRPRTFFDRAGEVGWSFVLEAHTTKEEILETYFRRAPYGGNTVGAAAAAMRWLGRPPAVLSPAEAALLAALPRAPGRCDPVRFPSAARAARNTVLARMGRNGWLPPDDLERAIAAPLPEPPPTPHGAPHFAAWTLGWLRDRGLSPTHVETTLDPAIQSRAEEALRRRIAELEGRRVAGGAVVVLDGSTSEVLAMVGSPDFESPQAGQVNAALAARQPGSAVKPFTYVAAFSGDVRPSTILADVPVSFGGTTGVFAPRNYAGGFTGPVTARQALANSWNVPTLEVQRRAGLESVARTFAAVGLPAPDLARLGQGVTLGAGETSLLDLAAAYATLARGGAWIEPHGVRSARGLHGNALLPAPDRRVACDPAACAWVNEILSDPAARAAAFPRGGPLEIDAAVAAKTGTSSDWRDTWAILYSTRHVVAVWMGNPDGRPTDSVTSAEGPAVVAREIFLAVEPGGAIEGFSKPTGIERRAVCALSGCAAGSRCPEVDWSGFRAGDPPIPACRIHLVCRIDVATSLLARPCTPEGRVRAVTFVELPARYRLWQADQGRSAPPRAATECLCGDPGCRALDQASQARTAEPEELGLVRPVDGTELAIDPTLAPGQQEMVLEALAPADVELRWSIDGRAVGRTRGIHRLFWPLAAGAHVVEVRSARARASASFRVLSAEFDEDAAALLADPR
jgi:penicillin-binding protein 1C